MTTPTRHILAAAAWVALALPLSACPSVDPLPEDPVIDETVGPQVLLEFDRDGFFDAPFPSEHRRGPDGRIPIDGFPTLLPVRPFVQHLLDLAHNTLTDFGTTSAIYFRLEVSATELPTLAETTQTDSPVFLVGVDPNGADYGVRVPLALHFEADGGPYGAVRLLSLLPLQGRPLAPCTTYAAVVTRDLPVVGGPLGQGRAVRALAAGEAVPGLTGDAWASYRAALLALDDLGTPPERVAGLAVFRTQDPTAELRRAVAWARSAAPQPTPLTPLVLTDVYDDYCVYRTEIEMPVFQAGTPPFASSGGGLVFDDDGDPVLQAVERARLDVTVPRRPPPVDGRAPGAVFLRTGGGADRALIDRGVRDATGAAAPGTGIARELAQAGYIGVEVDGPHGGIRNVTGGDEQFLMFNIGNPVAMRDNVRQSALEITLLPTLLQDLVIPAVDCPGVGASIGVRPDGLLLLGHSMGATIAPLVMALADEFDAVVLSGAGGSWIANVVHKESPLPVRPLADGIVGYVPGERTLTEFDPLLTLLQWAGESADPPVYARRVGTATDTPVEVLMVQGIVDTYILPPMANALSLSFGLDLVGGPEDAQDPRLDPYLSFLDVAPFGERPATELPYPASSNRGGRTGVVVQYPQDPIEDGHEVFFQRDEPKIQLACFLRSRLDGPAVVIDPAAACP